MHACSNPLLPYKLPQWLVGAFALSAAWRLGQSLKSSKTVAAADAPLVAAVGLAGWAVYKKVRLGRGGGGLGCERAWVEGLGTTAAHLRCPLKTDATSAPPLPFSLLLSINHRPSPRWPSTSWPLTWAPRP